MKKIRLFEIMQEQNRIDLKSVFAWLDKIDCKYLCVLHDKDKGVHVHYHIFVKMEGARDVDDIAKQCSIESNFIQIGRSWNNMLAYAFHLTDSAKDSEKFIYDHNAVVKARDVNIDDIFSNNEKIEYEQKHSKEVYDKLLAYGNLECTKQQVIDLMTAQDYIKYGKQFKAMQEYRLLQVRERNMKVVYITGGSGAGKTTLSKFMARSFNYDVFVSGSGKDALDGYDKQECIILDDLRSDVFSKAELFKLTDNNTNSSVKSRYYNKDISSCKLMIITSVLPPHKLYAWNDNTEESFRQFSRRLGDMFLWIKDGKVIQITYDANNISGKYVADFMKDAKRELAPYDMALVNAVLGIHKQLHNETITAINSAILKEIEIQQKEKEEQLTLDDLI